MKYLILFLFALNVYSSTPGTPRNSHRLSVKTSDVFDYEAVALGFKPGTSWVHKFGSNTDVDPASVPEDIWGGSTVYTGFPIATTETITCVSTDIDDDGAPAGNGAQTIQLSGLDANGLEQTETITMDGTTNVVTTNTWTRMNRITVLTAGSSQFNEGTITCNHTVTTGNVFAVMPPNGNRTHIAAYTIPADCTGLFLNMTTVANDNNANSVEGFIWVRETGKAPILIRPFVISVGTGPAIDPIPGGLVLPPLTDVTIRITDVNNVNAEVVSNFDILLSKN